MNTEARQDQAPISTGGRLRQARENLGLTQQAVARRLCLKISTVCDIEDDHANPNLASTFLRGYIRSYARLVNISEEEIIPMMAKEAPIKASQVAPMHRFSLGKTRQKRDGWLMGCTWLILFVVITLTGVWWWQNHQAQQKDIANIGNQSSSQLLQGDDATAVLLGDIVPQPPAETTPYLSSQAASASSEVIIPSSSPPQQRLNIPEPPTLPEAVAVEADGNTIVINFSGDCWLEAFDAYGKKLFGGIQHAGARLNLTGQAPYKLKIGAPAAVQIHYQGKPIDLSRFIRLNQVARLTVSASK